MERVLVLLIYWWIINKLINIKIKIIINNLILNKFLNDNKLNQRLIKLTI